MCRSVCCMWECACKLQVSVDARGSGFPRTEIIDSCEPPKNQSWVLWKSNQSCSNSLSQ